MVITYILFAVLFKNVVNLTLVSAIFLLFLGRRLILFNIPYWNILSSFMTNIWYCKCLLQLSGDIELNPGPQANSCKSFLVFHWNLNSVTCHNFIKVSLLTVYNSIHKFYIFCLSEMYIWSNYDSWPSFKHQVWGSLHLLQGITTINIM